MKILVSIVVLCAIQGALSQANACAGDVAKDLAAALAPFKTTQFVAAVNAAKVLDTTAWTIFAPTDAAWEAFLTANDIPLTPKSRSPAQAELINAVVKAHLVANNKVEVRYFQNGQTTTLQTLLKDMSVICGPGAVPGQQNQVEFTPVEGGFTNDGKQSGKAVAQVVSSGGVKVETVAADQEISCLQGFALHVVPEVLSPCKQLKSVAANPAAQCNETMATALQAAASTSSAAALLQKALPADFKGAVFVPTDAALGKLSTSLDEYVKTAQNGTSNVADAAQTLLNSEAMLEILQYHLASGASTLSSSTGQPASGPLTTLLSPDARKFCKSAPAATLSFTQVSETTGTISDGAGQAVNVLSMNETCNGTVAAIDTVLLPCSWQDSNVLQLLGADTAAPSPPPDDGPVTPPSGPTTGPTSSPTNSSVIDVVTPGPEEDPTVQIPSQTQSTYVGQIIIPGATNTSQAAAKRSLPAPGTGVSSSGGWRSAVPLSSLSLVCGLLAIAVSALVL